MTDGKTLFSIGDSVKLKPIALNEFGEVVKIIGKFIEVRWADGQIEVERATNLCFANGELHPYTFRMLELIKTNDFQSQSLKDAIRKWRTSGCPDAENNDDGKSPCGSCGKRVNVTDVMVIDVQLKTDTETNVPNEIHRKRICETCKNWLLL